MPAEIWKDRDVAAAFLNERSLLIPDRKRQLDVILLVVRFAQPAPKRVLDLGCGDGILLATLLEAFPSASGVGVDFSPLMLDHARARLAPFGQRAAAIEADLESPAWREAVADSFDIIVSGFAIHHLADARKRALYEEIYNLLNNSGAFVNAEHVASSTPRVETMFEDAMTRHLFERRRASGEDVTFEQVKRDFLERPDRAANILAPVETQCEWLRELGFKDVDCYWKYFELAVFGGVK
jgi:cyclopropane fatty-acyl-phospholipid synthase-like methyltransferase